MKEQSKYLGMFEFGTEVINKVKHLLADGWAEENIYLLLWVRGDFPILKYRKKPDKKLAEGVWQDHFQGFMSGESHVKKAMQFLETPLGEEYEKIKIRWGLVYADEGHLDYYYKQNSEFGNAAPSTVDVGATGSIDSTPGANHTDRPHYPRRGFRRVAMDGQNIRREGDRIVDPAAETGYDPDFYKLGQDGAHK